MRDDEDLFVVFAIVIAVFLLVFVTAIFATAVFVTAIFVLVLFVLVFHNTLLRKKIQKSVADKAYLKGYLRTPSKGKCKST